MQKKVDLKKLRKQKTPDELEELFSQFEEEFKTCENKMLKIKKTMDEIQVPKASEEEAEETGADPTSNQ